ncbi:hypothetical protein PLANPX_5709 [Lacipirellula parvula]|uniref:Uncharacterized protein n=1 Tax=Lacipirellula parvula TaxID=2650471 RepID=A0A5K7XJ37_9BACT|nr:hypothetical protein PLANPX_5709 [Lacipirellula parvula]
MRTNAQFRDRSQESDRLVVLTCCLREMRRQSEGRKDVTTRPVVLNRAG